MGGRIGLIDTAIRTADTGYITRRLVKALEDVRVAYDGTIRNSNNSIVQFAYSSDNFNPIKLEKQKIELLVQDDKQMVTKFKFKVDVDKKYWYAFMTKSAVEEMMKTNYIDELATEFKT